MSFSGPSRYRQICPQTTEKKKMQEFPDEVSEDAAIRMPDPLSETCSRETPPPQVFRKCPSGIRNDPTETSFYETRIFRKNLFRSGGSVSDVSENCLRLYEQEMLPVTAFRRIPERSSGIPKDSSGFPKNPEKIPDMICCPAQNTEDPVSSARCTVFSFMSVPL